MTISRLTPTQRIEIWQPRWKDRTVLIAKFKVGVHNEIVFTGGMKKQVPPSLKDKKFYMSGKQIQSYPLGTNTKIPCYEVPLDELEPLERV